MWLWQPLCGGNNISLLFHLFIATQELQVTVSPSAIASNSSQQFKIDCRAKNRQKMYNADYQFFFNGSAIAAPSKSSHIMDSFTSSGNFTCNATQYSDLGTAIPSPMSPPVQPIVLGEPTRLLLRCIAYVGRDEYKWQVM